jgi:hypothetical protein
MIVTIREQIQCYLLLAMGMMQLSLTSPFAWDACATRKKSCFSSGCSQWIRRAMPFDNSDVSNALNSDIGGISKCEISDRRAVLRRSLATLAATTAFVSTTAQADDVIPDGTNFVKTDSGLKYIELEEGSADGSTPRYGQLCIISYTAYMKLPNSSSKQKFATTSGFVIKHGNGKMIPGLDEGIHTMKMGGLRRLVIPPKLGFVTSGLGPMPVLPWQRWKLNSLLEDMITQRGGNLIYDVRLESFFDDEADQGYYEDDEISPEERAELESRLQRSQRGDSPIVDEVNLQI